MEDEGLGLTICCWLTQRMIPGGGDGWVIACKAVGGRGREIRGRGKGSVKAFEN